MKWYNLSENKLKKQDLQNWRRYKYENSVDASLAEFVAKVTKFNKDEINVWFAKKDKDNKFSLFKFEYRGQYYILKNNKLKEISSDDIFEK